MSYYTYIEVKKTVMSGTIRREEDHAWRLFIILLGLRDGLGEVRGHTWDDLAFKCGWETEDDRGKSKFDDAMRRLMSPDPESSSQVEEGRRVVQLGPNCYRLVNHEKYDEDLQAEKRRAAWRRRKADERERAAKKDAPAKKGTPKKAAAAAEDDAKVEAAFAKIADRKVVESSEYTEADWFAMTLEILNDGEPREPKPGEKRRWLELRRQVNLSADIIPKALEKAKADAFWAEKLPKTLDKLKADNFQTIWDQWEDPEDKALRDELRRDMLAKDLDDKAGESVREALGMEN